MKGNKAVLRLRMPRPRCQSTSLVGAGMGSNPIRSHLCWHTPRLI